MSGNDLHQVVILGASGDLTARKLVPALYSASCQKLFPGRLQLVGVARRPWDDAFFRDHLTKSAPKMQACSFDSWEAFLKQTTYVQTHLETTADYRALAAKLDQLAGGPAHRTFYLAVKPELFQPSVENLKA